MHNVTTSPTPPPGPPLVAPVNLTFNPSTTTLTWEEAPQQHNISYVCTATYPNGHVHTTNVTNGTTMVHYDLKDLNISGKITFEVQPVNCAGVGPNATYTTDWTYTPPTPQGMEGEARGRVGGGGRNLLYAMNYSSAV